MLGPRLGLLQALEGSEVKVRKVVCAHGQGRVSEVPESGGSVSEACFRTITLIVESVEKGKQSKRYQLKTYHKSGAKIIDAADFFMELIGVFEWTKGLS